MAYATGIREAELLALQVEHVVRTAEESKIRVLWQLDRYGVWPARSLPKHNKVRTTIIWDAFTDVVDSLVEDALARDDDTRGFLFPPMTRKSWPHKLTGLATKVKNTVGWQWDFHWLRHAFASQSLTSTDAGGYGLDVALVAEWLGHADPSTTLKMYLVKPKDSNKLAKLMTGRHPREGGPHQARRDR
jgi:integrase